MNQKTAKSLRRAVREMIKVGSAALPYARYQVNKRKKVISVDDADRETGQKFTRFVDVTADQIVLEANCPRAIYKSLKKQVRAA